MGKKLGFNSFLFKLRDAPKASSCYSSPSPSLSSSSSSWAWPSCTHPKTASFRDASACAGAGAGAAVYKTVNSVYFDSNESCFTRSSTEEEEEEEEEHGSFSEASGSEYPDSASGIHVRRLRSDRLFFEPGGTSSILDDHSSKPQPQPPPEAAAAAAEEPAAPFEDSVVMAMESEDPYGDFRRSMEEMVAAHGIKDWGQLEELLVWYLKVNGKATHGFIVGAFVDLLIGLASASPSPPLSSSSSASPSSSSSNSFKIEEIKEDDRLAD